MEFRPHSRLEIKNLEKPVQLTVFSFKIEICDTNITLHYHINEMRLVFHTFPSSKSPVFVIHSFNTLFMLM